MHHPGSVCPRTRRQFISQAALGLAALAQANATRAATATPWPIGCLNRPWTKWSADEMLDGVKAAGYKIVGLQTPTPADPFIGPTASGEYLATLKKKIEQRGLTPNVSRIVLGEAGKYEDSTAAIRRQFDHARTLGIKTVINTGTAKPDHFGSWYRLMTFAAAYGADQGIQVVTKPHGGVNAAAAELTVCIEKINHPNFGIWYDAGNIIFYTGKDPLVELEPILSRVTAFTAKDTTGEKGEVMIQFGQGKVNFPAIFRRLKKARFNGPIMVETSAPGATAAETTANVKANRLFLERTIAAL